MYLILFINFLIWSFVILVIATQVVMPMFTDYKFFWILTYLKVKNKYKDKLDNKSKKEIEQEIKKQLKH